LTLDDISKNFASFYKERTAIARLAFTSSAKALNLNTNPSLIFPQVCIRLLKSPFRHTIIIYPVYRHENLPWKGKVNTIAAHR